jgi:hypothetical protein
MSSERHISEFYQQSGCFHLGWNEAPFPIPQTQDAQRPKPAPIQNRVLAGARRFHILAGVVQRVIGGANRSDHSIQMFSESASVSVGYVMPVPERRLFQFILGDFTRRWCLLMRSRISDMDTADKLATPEAGCANRRMKTQLQVRNRWCAMVR